VHSDHEVIQIAERQLAEAEEAYRRDPSDANQRRIMKCWDAVRSARGDGDAGPEDIPWLTSSPRPPLQ
jgi:hypothetical protein